MRFDFFPSNLFGYSDHRKSKTIQNDRPQMIKHSLLNKNGQLAESQFSQMLLNLPGEIIVKN